jgi:hypothetical protein
MVQGNGKFVGEDREEMMELRALSSAVAIVVTLGACASGPPETAISSSLAVANDAINRARTDGALGAAPQSIANAQQKLAQAQDAAKAGQKEAAIRLADEAKAEADLADATSQAAQAENAAQQIGNDIGTLRQTTAPK